MASRTTAPLLVLLDDCPRGLRLTPLMRDRQAPTLAQCLSLSARQWYDALRRLIPERRRVGAIELASPITSRPLAQALVRLGVQLTVRQVRSLAEVPNALRRVRRSINVLWVPPRSVLLRAEYLSEILRYSLEEKLPVLAPTQSLVRSGFLASAEVDEDALRGVLTHAINRLARRQSATLPGAAPVRYAVNVETARRLDLEVRADELRWVHEIYPFPFEVRDLLDRYAASFQRRDVTQYKNVFWNASSRQLKGFERLVRTARDIRVRFETQRVERAEGADRMRLHVVQIFAFIDEKSDRKVSLRAPFQFQLERRNDEWRIAGFKQGR